MEEQTDGRVVTGKPVDFSACSLSVHWMFWLRDEIVLVCRFNEEVNLSDDRVYIISFKRDFLCIVPLRLIFLNEMITIFCDFSRRRNKGEEMGLDQDRWIKIEF